MVLFCLEALNVLHKQEVRIGSSILGGIFVLAIKNVGSVDEFCKALFVVQKDADEKNMPLQASVNNRLQTIRVIVAVAAIRTTVHGYRTFDERTYKVQTY